MQPNKSQVFYFAVLAIVLGCLAAVTPAYAAGRPKLLYRFAGPGEQVTKPGEWMWPTPTAKSRT